MAGIDLSTFATQALIVGVHAIGTAGGVQDTFNLERLVSDVGARTAESTTKAAETTTEVVNRATKAMQKAAIEAKDVIAEAGKDPGAALPAMSTTRGKASWRRFIGWWEATTRSLLRASCRYWNGSVTTSTHGVARQTGELLAKAAKQFYPDDPTTPMSKHARELHKQQQTLSATREANHRDLVTKVEELTTAVKVTASAKEAVATTASITPFKGESYATAIHELMEQIAAGLGDEYTDTGAIPGALPRNKKATESSQSTAAPLA